MPDSLDYAVTPDGTLAKVAPDETIRIRQYILPLESKVRLRTKYTGKESRVTDKFEDPRRNA